MNVELDDLLRRAALDTLSAAEREQLDAYLRENPAAQSDLEWDRGFAERLAAKIEAMPPLPGWERTLAQLQVQRHAQRPASAARTPGVLDRLGDWLRASVGMNFNAQALAAALVLAQAGVIGVLLWQDREPSYSDMRNGVQDATPRGPLLRVAFKQDIREAELRRALAEIGGEIVGGPGQIGVYLVRVKSADLAAAAERLRATGTTELVETFEAKK